MGTPKSIGKKILKGIRAARIKRGEIYLDDLKYFSQDEILDMTPCEPNNRGQEELSPTEEWELAGSERRKERLYKLNKFKEELPLPNMTIGNLAGYGYQAKLIRECRDYEILSDAPTKKECGKIIEDVSWEITSRKKIYFIKAKYLQDYQIYNKKKNYYIIRQLDSLLKKNNYFREGRFILPTEYKEFSAKIASVLGRRIGDLSKINSLEDVYDII